MRDLLYFWLANTAFSIIGIPIVAGVTYLAWKFR